MVITPSRRISIGVGLLLVVLFLPFSTRAATRFVPGIFQDTLWTNANSPYRMDGGFLIRAGATLTIEPGVVVKIDETFPVSPSISGTIRALGTASDPIFFTSLRDDTIGGDTNEDGSATLPAQAQGWGLEMDNFDGTSTPSLFEHVIFRYIAPQSIHLLENASVEVRHSVVEKSDGGFWATGTSTLLLEDFSVQGTRTTPLLASGRSTITADGVHIDMSGSRDPAISLSDSTLILRNALLENTLGTALEAFTGMGELDRITFKNNHTGLAAVKGVKPANEERFTLHQSSFLGNGTGVSVIPFGQYAADVSIDAKDNWWGSASGPHHALLNPNGTGDAVSDFVDFSPWLIALPGSPPPPPTNIPPILSYSSEIGYGDDATSRGVDPNVGTASSTPFVFKIIYTDADNNAPTGVSLVLKDNNVAVRYPMTVDPDAVALLRDGDFTNGEEHSLALTLPKGSYEYSFETSDGTDATTLPPASGTLPFESGLFITPKRSANIRASGGITAAILTTANRGEILELLPLCTMSVSQNCNDPTSIYTRTDGHYWLKVGFNSFIGYIAEDILMTIISHNQPETVLRIMREQFADSAFDPLRSLPLELLLAIAAHESAGTLNNEIISTDSPFGGIMQIHPSKGKQNTNCINNTCLEHLDYWTEVNNQPTDLFGIPIRDEGNKVFQLKNYINTLYQNTEQGIGNNTTDGLNVLKEKNGFPCKNTDVSWTDKNGVPYNITQSDFKKICAVWAYNGVSLTQNYLRDIANSLQNIGAVFPGAVYPNTDQLIEKFRLANDHRKEIKVFSPVELRVSDSSGRITGVVNGTPQGGVPNAVYDPATEATAIFFPQDTYRYTVVGTAMGTYGIAFTDANDGATTEFSGQNIPITPGAIHEYAIDETVLAQGGKGVAIRIDQDGDGTFDYQFTAGAKLADTETPKTTISPSGTQGLNGWYVSDVAVTLTAQDNAGGVGVRRTEYSLDQGATWQNYTNPFMVTREGLNDAWYRSEDFLGNREAVASTTIKIDKTPPEAHISFDLQNKTLGVRGNDNLSSATVVKTSSAYLVSDEAGHTLTLTLKTRENNKQKIKASIISLRYNQLPLSKLVENMLAYEWDIQRGVVKKLEQKVEVGRARATARYHADKNQTIVILPKQKGEEKERKKIIPGIAILGIDTNAGAIILNIP